MNVPEEWRYYTDNNKNTDAMISALNGNIPDIEKYHNPKL